MLWTLRWMMYVYQKENKTMFWVAISKFVCGLLAAKKDCSWCRFSVKSKNVLGVVYGKAYGKMIHVPSSCSSSLPCDSASQSIDWMVNNQENPFGIIKKRVQNKNYFVIPKSKSV